MRAGLLFIACLILPLLASCTVPLSPPGPGPTEPRLAADSYVTGDGVELPLSRWLPEGEPKAAVLALHGLNDYATAFELPAEAMAEAGIAVYAYDQRGFGRGPDHGTWAGHERYIEDAVTATHLLARRYPEVPVYLLGESMGGGIAAAAAERLDDSVEGLVLLAPAVWGRDIMPFGVRATLWMAARLAPWYELTGGDLEVRASDNDEALARLWHDPLVVKATRVATIEGLTDLMDEALAAAPKLEGRVLILYGARDQIVRPGPMLAFWERLPNGPETPAERRPTVAFYTFGWHLLLRDLGRETPIQDLIAWLLQEAPGGLPSGMDRDAQERLRHVVEVAG